MPQFNWTYVGGEGRNFHVTLFHGKRTGHVLLLLNKQVVQIDFGVRESKTYSFFIEDEFCRVRLERRGDEMYYFFEIDKKVDTPRNRERKKQDRRFMIQTLVFFGALILVASSVALGFQAYNKNRKAASLAEQAYTDSTLGWVKVDTLPSSRLVSYYFVVGNYTYSGSSVLKEGLQLPEPEFPLLDGDEFLIRYLDVRPEFSRISFDQPSERQVQRYLERAISHHLVLHPEAYLPQVRCSLEVALEMRGLAGVADFFYQEVSPADNPLHNENSYLRLVRDPGFLQAVEQRCWD